MGGEFGRKWIRGFGGDLEVPRTAGQLSTQHGQRLQSLLYRSETGRAPDDPGAGQGLPRKARCGKAWRAPGLFCAPQVGPPKIVCVFRMDEGAGTAAGGRSSVLPAVRGFQVSSPAPCAAARPQAKLGTQVLSQFSSWRPGLSAFFRSEPRALYAYSPFDSKPPISS